MKAALARTGSVPIQLRSPPISGSPIRNLRRSGSVSGEKVSKAISLSLDVNRGRDRSSVRRASSEINIASGFGSLSERISEEDDLLRASKLDSWQSIVFSGGDGGDSGGDGRFEDRSKIGEHYETMLKKNPGDPLLLRNYGKYLHEVARDWVRAEECYGRAILASDGGDGELFSMYGRLIWESQRDTERAKSYFDQAVTVSPHDCTVLGSYARFIWEAGEDDEEKEDDGTEWNLPSCPALVPAL